MGVEPVTPWLAEALRRSSAEAALPKGRGRGSRRAGHSQPRPSSSAAHVSDDTSLARRVVDPGGVNLDGRGAAHCRGRGRADDHRHRCVPVRLDGQRELARSRVVRVFVSYRRSDSSAIAGRLCDRLRAEFGKRNIFYDVDSVDYGVDFRDVMVEKLARVDVVLVLIGKRWDPQRLHASTDYVRIEISEALRQGKRVVPVLLDNFEMPSPDILPSGLRKLAYLNASRLRLDPDFHRDATRIIEFLIRLQIPTTARALASFRRRLYDGELDGDVLLRQLDLELRSQPANAWALVARGSVKAISRGDLDGAMADFNRAIRLNPANSGAFYGRATVRRDRQELDLALADFTQAIDLEPTNSIARSNRGFVRLARRDLEKALEDFDEAIHLEPTHSTAYDGRGRVREARQDFRGAMADYNQAIRLDGRQPQFFEHRASLRRRRGEALDAEQDEAKAKQLRAIQAQE